MIRQKLVIAAALLLTACGGEKREVYERPLAEAHSILADDDELPPVFGDADPDLRMDSGDPKAVSWVLSLEGSEIMRFVATLTPETEKSTAVTLAVKAPTEGPLGNVEKRLNDHPEIRDLYVAAMWEQIASQMENREYDMTRIFPAISRATAANIGSITRRMEAAGEADRKRDEENIRKAYAEEAEGR